MLYTLTIQAKNAEDLDEFLSWLRREAEYSFYNYLFDDGLGVADDVSNTFVFNRDSSTLTINQLRKLPRNNDYQEGTFISHV